MVFNEFAYCHLKGPVQSFLHFSRAELSVIYTSCLEAQSESWFPEWNLVFCYMCIFVSSLQGYCWTLPPVFASQSPGPGCKHLFFPFNSFALGRKRRNGANYTGLDTYKTWQRPWEPVYKQASRGVLIFMAAPPLLYIHRPCRFISPDAMLRVCWSTAKAWAYKKMLLPVSILICCLRAGECLDSCLKKSFV